MSINIEDTNIDLVRDVHKEYVKLPISKYLDHAPITYGPKIEDDGGKYLHISLRKKDNLCYIKVKGLDLWLYNIKGKPIFLPLHIKNDQFTFNQPVVCWIEYLREPTFIIYRSLGYGVGKSEYLIHKKVGKKMILSWTPILVDATIFFYDKIRWKAHLSESVDKI
jgi:hypothetical protein